VRPPAAAAQQHHAPDALRIDAFLLHLLYLAHAAGALAYERAPDAPPLLHVLDAARPGPCIVLLRPPASHLLAARTAVEPDLDATPLFSIQRPGHRLPADAPRSSAYTAVTPRAFPGWPRAKASGGNAQLQLSRAIALLTRCAAADQHAARLGDERSWYEHALRVRGYCMVDRDAPLPWSPLQLKYRKDRLVICVRRCTAAATRRPAVPPHCCRAVALSPSCCAAATSCCCHARCCSARPPPPPAAARLRLSRLWLRRVHPGGAFGAHHAQRGRAHARRARARRHGHCRRARPAPLPRPR
jgi:hypothetical protein